MAPMKYNAFTTKSRLRRAPDILELLAGTAEDMEPAMKTIHERLVSIHRQLGEMRAKRGHTFRDLAPLQSELDAVDSGRDQGVFAGSPQTKVPRGQAVCAELLDANYNLVGAVKNPCVRTS